MTDHNPTPTDETARTRLHEIVHDSVERWADTLPTPKVVDFIVADLLAAGTTLAASPADADTAERAVVVAALRSAAEDYLASGEPLGRHSLAFTASWLHDRAHLIETGEHATPSPVAATSEHDHAWVVIEPDPDAQVTVRGVVEACTSCGGRRVDGGEVRHWPPRGMEHLFPAATSEEES